MKSGSPEERSQRSREVAASIDQSGHDIYSHHIDKVIVLRP